MLKIHLFSRAGIQFRSPSNRRISSTPRQRRQGPEPVDRPEGGQDAGQNYARTRGLGEVWGTILRENTGMIDLVRRLGFTIRADADDPSLVTASLKVRADDQ